MKNEVNNSERTIEEVIKEYDELVQKSKGIDPSWKDEEVNALMDRINELEKEYDQTAISFEMEIFQGYTCIGCAVVNDLEVEVEFSLEELSKMRYLVSQLDEDLYSEGIMPVLRDGAPELYERMMSAVRKGIRSPYSVDDQVSMEELPEYTVDIPVAFLP